MHEQRANGEEELISGVQQGDQEAMRRIYLLHVRYLTAVCSRYVVDPEDVRDILQDSFIRIFENIDKYKPQGNASLRSWMTRIVINNSLKFLKKNERLRFVETVDEYPDIADEPSPDVCDIPYEETRRMIGELPAGYRTVLNLYVFERKSHKEIAEILGIKADTSASQFHKAKRMLTAKIRKYKEKEGEVK